MSIRFYYLISPMGKFAKAHDSCRSTDSLARCSIGDIGRVESDEISDVPVEAISSRQLSEYKPHPLLGGAFSFLVGSLIESSPCSNRTATVDG